MAEGWIKVDRSIFESDAFGRREKFSKREAFIWMVSEAAWKDNGRVRRGQLVHTIRHMADVWGWKKSTVWDFILRLQNSDTVRTQAGTTNRTSRLVITICNYEKYQDDEPETRTTTRTQPGHNPDKTRTSKKKEEEEEEGYTDRTLPAERVRQTGFDDLNFEEWWKAYPKKVGKGQARKAYRLACKKTDPPTLLAGVEAYRRNKPQFQDWCHPATWLNGERWLDERPADTREVEIEAAIAEVFGQ